MIVSGLLTVAPAGFAVVYQSGPDFIAETFAPAEADSRSLWLTPHVRDQAEKILTHPVAGLRVRFFQSARKTAWILDETGKERPITVGIVIEDERILDIKILAYRESRGGEVRYPAYTRQYRGSRLSASGKLDKTIDGITGATLSVRAVTNVSRLALYYHSLVMHSEPGSPQPAPP